MVHLFVNLWSLFDLIWYIVVCDCWFVVYTGVARCILERTAEKYFLRPRSRSGLTFLVWKNTAQRAVNFCSALEAIYSALKYTAPVNCYRASTRLLPSFYRHTVRCYIVVVGGVACVCRSSTLRSSPSVRCTCSQNQVCSFIPCRDSWHAEGRTACLLLLFKQKSSTVACIQNVRRK
jgi:hypothetical protein